MKVEVVERPAPREVTLFNMRPGEVGVDKDGNYFYRTSETATCLNSHGETYSRIDAGNNHRVTLLPTGTRLAVTV